MSPAGLPRAGSYSSQSEWPAQHLEHVSADGGEESVRAAPLDNSSKPSHGGCVGFPL